MLDDGQLITVAVGNDNYFALPRVTELLDKKLSQNRVLILSPFDNLLIQRQRMKTLFNYDYQIECYVPADKRKFGYFSLPLLWGQSFAGRLDAKMDRKSGILSLIHLHIESNEIDAFIMALKPTLDKFLVFNNAQKLAINNITTNNASLNKNTVKRLSAILTNKDKL